MKLNPDDPNSPDIPFDPPEEMEKLKQLAPEIQKILTKKEDIEKMVVQSAEESADGYVIEGGDDFDECVAVVSIALKMTGEIIGGEAGKLMAERGPEEAKKACKKRLSQP